MKIPRSFLQAGDDEKKEKKIAGKMKKSALKSFKAADSKEDASGN